MKRPRAPAPYFGHKPEKICAVIWEALGDPPNYVEAFAGMLGPLLARPNPGKVETINDASGLVTNLWRAIQADPEGVARHADQPVHELDLHAWHALLVREADGLRERLGGDPRAFDVELAGRWAWGASAWLGGGWCDGRLHKRRPVLQGRGGTTQGGVGVHRDGLAKTRPHLGGGNQSACAGQGVHSLGVHRKRPAIGGQGDRPHVGVGVHAGLVGMQLPHLSGGAETGVGYGRGVHQRAGQHSDGLVAWMKALADRLRFVRVCCGDFARVLTPAVTTSHGLTGVVLDPPYDLGQRASRIYEVEDAPDIERDKTVAQRAAAWAREHGDNPLLRIVLCGLEGEHDMPGWTEVAWKTGGGYGNQTEDGRGRKNAERERLWLSPHCLKLRAHKQLSLGVEA